VSYSTTFKNVSYSTTFKNISTVPTEDQVTDDTKAAEQTASTISEAIVVLMVILAKGMILFMTSFRRQS